MSAFESFAKLKKQAEESTRLKCVRVRQEVTRRQRQTILAKPADSISKVAHWLTQITD